MRAAYASAAEPDQPLAALTVGDLPEPTPPDGWVTVDVRASSLNHHEIWALRGVGLPGDRLPMILGCDAAGVDAPSREAWKRERVAELGATALEAGVRLPERVDVVIESVGAPTFDHSMK